MTAQEANEWKNGTANNPNPWVIDEIHCSDNDLLLYQGKENGYYAHYRNHILSLGIFNDALGNIGDALFQVQGSKRFNTPKDAMLFLVTKGRIRLAPTSVRQLMKKGLL